ncbi:hypothetical protein [Maribacter sp. 2307UL18-2]|uniref:hypothetical protein n=1 Tax=Maribacter sp. 2307UL18-2 TaxID=3386274 RepID=UPI0039BCB047
MQDSINRYFKRQLKAGNTYSVRRHGGLYLNNDFVKHEHLSEPAQRRGIDPSVMHGQMVTIAREHQRARQLGKTSVEIFKEVETYLKKTNIDGSLGRAKTQPLLIEAIADAFDEGRVFITSNPRRSFLMPCSDKVGTGFTKNELVKVFESFINAAGLSDSLNSEHAGYDLMDAFLAKIIFY